jgi:4-alpha-glucanotransferase
MTFSPDDRIAGVLVPLFAIRGQGDLGIGDTASLIEFIDWAAENGLHLVKLLPINETGGDHSPYNALSSRALDPTTIRTSPEALRDLSREEYEAAQTEAASGTLKGSTVDYDVVKPLKRRLLEAAFARFGRNQFSRKSARAREFLRFTEEQGGWLDDYALFRTLLEDHAGRCWDSWPEEHRSPEAARRWLAALGKRQGEAFARRMRFFAYVQWIAFTQWREVKAHAAGRGVGLMGDIPFGISYQSADRWSHPQLFRTGWCGGTPPDRIFKHDAFVQKWGQNWGIPLYDWPAHACDDFQWWRQRVGGIREFFDLFRIDHVLGFYRIYGFPWAPDRNAEFLPLTQEEAQARTGGVLPGFQPRPDDTPENKEQNRRDGERYLTAILEEAGRGRVIGEDLGEVPDYVRPNLQALGIAGYKVPQWEKRWDGSLIPGAEYERLSLATYATHDHDPLRAMWEQLVRDAATPAGDGARYELRVLCDYAGLPSQPPPPKFTREVHLALLRALFQSNSWIAVAMITDLFGRSERFNSPGVASGANWTQRLHAPIGELRAEPLLPSIRQLLHQSGRVHR